MTTPFGRRLRERTHVFRRAALGFRALSSRCYRPISGSGRALGGFARRVLDFQNPPQGRAYWSQSLPEARATALATADRSQSPVDA